MGTAATQALTQQKLQGDIRAQAVAHSMDNIARLQDKDQAVQYLTAAYADPRLGPIYQQAGPLQQIIGQIPDDPAQFNSWKTLNLSTGKTWMEQNAPKPQSIGSGGLRLGSGEIIPPAARPNAPLLPSQKVRTKVAGENQVQEELQDDGTWKEIGRGPRFAKSVGTTVQMPTPPVVQTDKQGNVRLYDRSGNLIKDLGRVGKPSGTFEKTQAAQQKLSRDLTSAISELERATVDGGLIDKSTGSGIGAGVDWAARGFGAATPGAIAVGALAPIYDLVLKMVPRFEGPQSDKDTASYKEASGNLANPNIPNVQKKAAAKEILRLMKARKAQFISKDMEGTEVDASTGPRFLGFE